MGLLKFLKFLKILKNFKKFQKIQKISFQNSKTVYKVNFVCYDKWHHAENYQLISCNLKIEFPSSCLGKNKFNKIKSIE